MVVYERVFEAVFRCEAKQVSVQSGRLRGSATSSPGLFPLIKALGTRLTGSGRYERVDCSFEFYPLERQKHNANDRPY